VAHEGLDEAFSSPLSKRSSRMGVHHPHIINMMMARRKVEALKISKTIYEKETCMKMNKEP